MRPAFKRFIEKYGAEPTKSWRRFLIGLSIFFIGLLGYLSQQTNATPWLHYLTILVMLCGFVIAMRGYIGIFASRFNRIL